MVTIHEIPMVAGGWILVSDLCIHGTLSNRPHLWKRSDALALARLTPVMCMGCLLAVQGSDSPLGDAGNHRSCSFVSFASAMYQKAVLVDLIKEHALRFGEFKLASGKIGVIISIAGK